MLLMFSMPAAAAIDVKSMPFTTQTYVIMTLNLLRERVIFFS